MDPTSGVIYLRQKLEKIERTIYSFQVQASDQKFPPKVVITNVQIVVARNEYPPKFDFDTYSKIINEKLPINSSVIGVNAFDRDKKGEIMYEVVGILSAPTYFWLDKRQVRVLNDLTTDQTLEYQLRIAAYDSADPETKAYTTVLITVTRNANPPRFNPFTYSAHVIEEFPLGGKIKTLKATDSDGDKISYQLVAPRAALPFFYVNPTSGEVFLIKELRDLNTRPLVVNFDFY